MQYLSEMQTHRSGELEMINTGEDLVSCFAKLFIRPGDQQLCAIGELKHWAEYFSDIFIGRHIYVERDVAARVLIDCGFRVKEQHIYGALMFPDYDELVAALGNGNFDEKIVGTKQIVPFYRIPHRRVRAMVEANSSAWRLGGRYASVFPLFERFDFDRLHWIEEEGGLLAYKVLYGEVMLDTIYVENKRTGMGKKLFKRFLESVVDVCYNDPIIIDAYTQESKAFFSSMAKRYNVLKPSGRFVKPDVYEIDVAEIMSDSKKGEWMNDAIKELFSKGIIKACENKGLYDCVLANKDGIEAHFAIIKRGVLVVDHEETVYLCAPILELDPNYDPYENVMPSLQEFENILVKHAAENPEFAEMLRSMAKQ